MLKVKKVIRKLYKVLNVFKKLFIKRKTLNRETVVICRSSWAGVNPSSYNNKKYDVICVNSIDEIHPNSYEKIVAYIGDIPKARLKQLINLKWLQVSSHGFNGFESKDLYANERIVVTNMHGVFSKPMAYFCFSAWYMFHCFALRRTFSPGVSKHWVRQDEKELSVLIYGFGDIGSEIAKLFKNQGWKVYGVKRGIPEKLPDYIDDIVNFSGAEKYLNECDYIINVLPETKETIGIFDRNFFSKMNKDAVFCNVGRGSAVVDKDLENAVKESTINGAILDACSSYPYNHPNIVLTHHYSSFAKENDKRINMLFSAQLKKFLEEGENSVEYKIPLV